MRRFRLLPALLAVAVAGAIWFFAPAQLGGSTVYSATVGTSMEPLFHKGDLALLRPASSYSVGDIVLYRSPVLQRPVLHRILVIQNGHYFLKGDHNDFVDPGYVTRKDLVGKLWFRVPKAGRIASWFGVPLHASILAALAVVFLVLGGARKAGRRKRGRGRRSGRRPSMSSPARPVFRRPRLTPAFVAGTVALLLALILLPVGFLTPLQRTAPLPDAYRQEGTFSYTAHVVRPDSAYPSGIAGTGQPLFLNNFKAMQVRFSYRFASRLPHDVEGTSALRLLISSDLSWHSLYTLSKPRTFHGDTTTMSGTIDLVKLRALITQLAIDSGTVGADYAVDLQPVVRVHGLVGGKKVAQTFSPVLPITVNQSVVKLNVSQSAAPPGATYAPPSAADTLAAALNPTLAGTVPAVAPNYVHIARYSFPVSAIRGLGLGLAALGLLALVSQRFHRRRDIWSPEKRIAFRHDCVIVDVVSIGDETGSGPAPVSVADFTSLATLAQYCERPILRETGEQQDTYAVQDDGRLFLHRSRRAPAPAAEAAPSREEPQPPPRPPAGTRRRFVRLAGVIVAVAVVSTLVVSYTAKNTVPLTHAGRSIQTLQLGQLTPTQCASITIARLIVASANTTTGTSQKDLILGKKGPGSFSYNGSGGDDCIVAGGGPGTTNTINGGNGNDICIGAPGATNNFSSCLKTY